MFPFRMPGPRSGHAACLAALAWAASTASAQTPPSRAAGEHLAGPAAPPGAVLVLPADTSAFRDHRPFSDAPPTDWRGANDNVGRIGGWRAYAREAQQADGVQSPRPQEGGAASHHGGHR